MLKGLVRRLASVEVAIVLEAKLFVTLPKVADNIVYLRQIGLALSLLQGPRPINVRQLAQVSCGHL